MNEYSKETLDYLFEKFGVVVDYTKDNILSYLQLLYSKIARYIIIRDIIILLVLLAFIIVSILIIKKILKDPKTDSKFYYRTGYGPDAYEMEPYCVIFMIISVITIVIAILCLVSQILSIIKDITIPEVQVFNFIKSM